MGLKAAGKTTIIKHVLEWKEFDEIVNLAATEGIETPAYKYRGLIEINVFDCGGQTQFLENYYSESLIGTIFGGKTRILFWVVDSSDKSSLEASRAEFFKALEAVRKYSTVYPLVYVLVHKFDKHQLLKKEIEEYFKENKEIKGVHFYTTSCVSGTARKVIIRLLDEIVKKESESRIKSLQRILRLYNSKINAHLSTLINSDDGLEIASDFRRTSNISDDSEIIEFLQYVSVKVMTESLDKAKKIFDQFKYHHFISDSEYYMVVWKLKNESVLFFRLHEKVFLLSIVNNQSISIDKCVRELKKVVNEILEILKLY